MPGQGANMSAGFAAELGCIEAVHSTGLCELHEIGSRFRPRWGPPTTTQDYRKIVKHTKAQSTR